MAAKNKFNYDLAANCLQHFSVASLVKISRHKIDRSWFTSVTICYLCLIGNQLNLSTLKLMFMASLFGTLHRIIERNSRQVCL